MTLEQVKNYLRVDFEEDDTYIELLIDVSESFLFSLTGKLDPSCSLYNELIQSQEVKAYTPQQIKLSEVYRLALINEMYESRGLTVESANDKIKLVYASILSHLRYS